MRLAAVPSRGPSGRFGSLQNLTVNRFSPMVASGNDRMKQVTIRLELRVSEEMNEFLQLEAQSRKLSFEGLLLMYIQERMKQERIDRQHSGPSRGPGPQGARRG